jgi:hypothetical protein
MKKYLLFGLVAVMMAACSSEDSLTDDGNLDANTEGSRYMAISLVTNEQGTSGTRGDDDASSASTADKSSFGEEGEYKVSGKDNIIFYFFDSTGDAYDVGGSGNNYMTPTSIGDITTADDGTESVDSKDLNFTDGDGNITSVSNLILAFKNQRTTKIPAQVVVLVNAPTTYKTKYATLDALRAAVASEESGQHVLVSGSTIKYFLMSNSVYQNETTGKIVDATPITSDNIKTSAVEVAKNPVVIHVERVDAKVTLTETTLNGTYYEVKTPGIYSNQSSTLVSSDNEKVYVKILGWTLYNKIKGYNLIKSLTAETGHPWWNAEGDYRSFWANMPASGTSLTSTALSYETVKGSDSNNGHIEYALENTNTTNNTGVILAAQLYKKSTSNGTDTYTELEIAKFLSQYYTRDDLKKAVANYRSDSLWYKEPESTADNSTETTWYTITPDDIDFVAATDPSYTVTATLSSAGKKKTWYASKGATTPLDQTATSGSTAATVESILKNMPRIQIWKDGYCYYYAPIQHNITYSSGSETNTMNKTAIVRNHWYEVSVKSITGLGTPVWDPTVSVTPTNPGTDDDQEWYLDAQIKILSWKKVTSSLDFGTTSE